VKPGDAVYLNLDGQVVPYKLHLNQDSVGQVLSVNDDGTCTILDASSGSKSEVFVGGQGIRAMKEAIDEAGD
jgi:hypothetical protein